MIFMKMAVAMEVWVVFVYEGNSSPVSILLDLIRAKRMEHQRIQEIITAF